LILEDRRQDAMRGIPQDAVSDVVAVEWKEVHCWNILEDMVAILKEKAHHIHYGAIPWQAMLKLFHDIPKYQID
jgi:homoserine trans-succinylase